jgi:hypothetical protein
MSSLFDKLLNLYGQGSRTPLEDFTTEILAATLESDENFKQNFINEILRIEGDDYHIQTQSIYLDARIDLVFENSKNICFLENKVESTENKGQLNKYKNILLKLKKEKGKNVYLRYCTKYYESKKMDFPFFGYFRWLDIAKLIHTKYKNEISLPQNLLSHFYVFLQNNDMAEEIELNTDDIKTMEKMKGLLRKITDITIQNKSEFEKYFGKSGQSNLNDSQMYNRFIIYCSDTFLNGDIGIGFEWGEEPKIVAWITWRKYEYTEKIKIIEESCTRYENFKKSSASDKDNFRYEYSKRLAEFTGSNINSQIGEWFRNNIDELVKFILENPNLGWFKQATIYIKYAERSKTILENFKSTEIETNYFNYKLIWQTLEDYDVFLGFRYGNNWYYSEELLDDKVECIVYIKDTNNKFKNDPLIKKAEKILTESKLGKIDLYSDQGSEVCRLAVRKSFDEFSKDNDKDIIDWFNRVIGLLEKVLQEHV